MGAIRDRAKIYPANLSPVKIPQELKDALAEEMARTGVTESDVVREWLELGRQAAARRAKRAAAE